MRDEARGKVTGLDSGCTWDLWVEEGSALGGAVWQLHMLDPAPHLPVVLTVWLRRRTQVEL